MILRMVEPPPSNKPPAPCYDTCPHPSSVGMICKGKCVEGDDSFDTGKFRNVECNRDFAKDNSIEIKILALHMELRHTGRPQLKLHLTKNVCEGGAVA